MHLFSIFILSLSHDLVLPMKVVFVCILELFNPAILCLLQQLLGDPLVAVVWNAARKGLEPRSEFRLQHGLSWM